MDRCGASYDIMMIVSRKFEGMKLIEKHRLINDSLREEMKEIHALSIKKALTPSQYAEQKK
jgi:stress-induced morphogen